MKNKIFRKVIAIITSSFAVISYMTMSVSAATYANCETRCGNTPCSGALRYESGRNRAYVEGFISENPSENTLIIDASVRAGYKISTSSNLIYTTESSSSKAGGIRVTNTPISNGTFQTATGTINFTVNGSTTGDIGLGPISSR